MKREKIIDLFKKAELIGTEVTVMGWVRTRRGNKHVQFVALNDGSTVRTIQIVLFRRAAETNHYRLGSACRRTSCRIYG